jgi:hypothetical protein
MKSEVLQSTGDESTFNLPPTPAQVDLQQSTIGGVKLRAMKIGNLSTF